MPASTLMSMSMAGDEELLVKISALQTSSRNWKLFLNDVAVDFTKIEADAFATEGVSSEAPIAPKSAISGPWQKNAFVYSETKRVRFGSARVLEFTGALRDSLTSPEAVVKRMTATQLSLGTDIRYAQYHQQPQGFTAWAPHADLFSRSSTNVDYQTTTDLSRGRNRTDFFKSMLKYELEELQREYRRRIRREPSRKQALNDEFKQEAARLRKIISEQHRDQRVQFPTHGAIEGYTTRIPRQHVTSRPPIRITASDRQRWAQIMREHALMKVRRAGL